MRRELETGLRNILRATAPAPDPTSCSSPPREECAVIRAERADGYTLGDRSYFLERWFGQSELLLRFPTAQPGDAKNSSVKPKDNIRDDRQNKRYNSIVVLNRG